MDVCHSNVVHSGNFRIWRVFIIILDNDSFLKRFVFFLQFTNRFNSLVSASSLPYRCELYVPSHHLLRSEGFEATPAGRRRRAGTHRGL
jgi:hypothetical protein